MSEGVTSTTKMWRGIPLSHVRSSFFVDKLGTVTTLMKLIINNDATEFTSAEDGAVTMDGSYLNWMFIAPVGAFNISEFAGKNVGEFFQIIANRTSSRRIEAWEEFITFINSAVSMVNNIMSQGQSESVQAPFSETTYPLASIPTFRTMSSFSDFITWIFSFIPSGLKSQPATELQSDNAGGQYTYTVILNVVMQDDSQQAMSFSFVI